MFNQDFFPTPEEVILRMTEGYEIRGKIFLDPEGGKGDIVDFLWAHGAADVISCEKNEDLRKILATKCKVIADDFLTVESHQISHVDYIIMNPPFSADDKHIIHAWGIAPAGCRISALCNSNTLKNKYIKSRERLSAIVEEHGNTEDLGDCFSKAQRKTDVEVTLIRLCKPGANYSQEFEGFFMDEDPEEVQYNGIMPYNIVRDLVNRYIAAVKLFDEQLNIGVRMNELTSQFYSSEIAFSCTEADKPKSRNEFKKDLQKSAWNYIFSKMNMGKYTTKGLKEEINKFVERQEKIPFTMRNIYKMLEMVIGTQESRMDKALLEVFDKVTGHYHENRYNLEGWKTNSHYLLNRRFIVPSVVSVGWSGQVSCSSSSNSEMIEDLVKALCYINGDNYSHKVSLDDFISYPFLLVKDGKYLNEPHYEWDVKIKERHLDDIESRQKQFPESRIEHNIVSWGEWIDWGYFRFRCYKKGTIHMEFLDEDLWAKFNQRIARIKGYPLYESVKKEKPWYEAPKERVKPTILATIKI
jgi:hypothetical protein